MGPHQKYLKKKKQQNPMDAYLPRGDLTVKDSELT